MFQFKIHDKVWIMHLNQIIQPTIFRRSETGRIGSKELNRSYRFFSPDILLMEDHIFSSKKELIKKLLGGVTHEKKSN